MDFFFFFSCHSRIDWALVEITYFSVQGCLAGQLLLTTLTSATSMGLVYCICLNN